MSRALSLLDLARPHIRDLKAYPPGKPIEELERELGISGAIKLASNESPISPSPRVIAALAAAAANLNRYPDGSCFNVRKRLASHLGIKGESLIFGAGSDELLEMLVKVFLDPGDEVVYPWPSFAMYPIVTTGMGGRRVEVPPVEGLRTDPDKLCDAITERTKLLFLANPNNPTGTCLGKREIERILERTPERVVIVLDEAYAEYVRRPDYPQSLDWIGERRTLLVLRTFSKIFGLAGLRLGYAAAHPEMIQLLERARHPFNVGTLAQVAACAALDDMKHVEQVRDLAHRGLRQLEVAFDKLGLPYVPSDANFVLVEVGEKAREIDANLKRKGVIVRSMAEFGLTRHLRITAGTPDENERLIEALAVELGR